MAPEVLREEGADVRSDVYSFGVVLYQMLTGNPGVHLVNRYELAPLARVDSILWPVIERCLVAQGRSRYPSFTLVRRELEGLVKKSGGVVIALPEINELTAWEWNDKGFSLANLGRHDEAMACYHRALEIPPRHALAWNNKGTGLLELGPREEAIPYFDRALEIDFDALAWSNKGGVLASLGRREEGLPFFDRALEIDPRNAVTWNSKGQVLSDTRPQGGGPHLQ